MFYIFISLCIVPYFYSTISIIMMVAGCYTIMQTTILLLDEHNQLCEYLFELSQRFNQFYENCPVLKAETIESRRSRAALCELTADTLKLSLGLLGIETVEKL